MMTSDDGMTPAEREKIRLDKRSLKVAQTSFAVAALALCGSILLPIFMYYRLQSEIRISQLKQRAFSATGYLTDDACLKEGGGTLVAIIYSINIKNTGEIPIRDLVVTLQPSKTAKIIDRQAIHADPPTRRKIEDAGAGSLSVTYEDPLPPRSTYSLIVAKTPYQEVPVSSDPISFGYDLTSDPPPEAWAASEISNSRVSWEEGSSLEALQPCP